MFTASITLSLFFGFALLAQKPESKPAPAGNTQKNTDGTTTTTEAYGTAGKKSTTKDAKGEVIDIVIEEPDSVYGKGGTKTSIESHNGGRDIDIVVRKDSSGKVRHIEQTEFTRLTKKIKSVDYEADGRLKAVFVGGNNVDQKIAGDVEYDHRGQPLRESIKIDGDQYRISYEYVAEDERTATAERYFEGRWVPANDSLIDFLKTRAATISNEISMLVRSTERIPNSTGNLGATPTKSNESSGDSGEQPKLPAGEVFKPKVNSEKPKTSTSSSPKEKPRRGAPPPQTATHSGRAIEPTAITSASGAISPCLIGVWQSHLVELWGPEPQGLLGIILTIRADGTITIDYHGMQPIPASYNMQLKGGDKISWAGVASGHIDRDGKTSVTKAEITETETGNGVNETRNWTIEGMGPAELQTDLTCDATTLRYRNTHFGGFTFKRTGTVPR
jgi:hypothetical protein